MRKLCSMAIILGCLFAGDLSAGEKKGITDYISLRVKPEKQAKLNRYIITGGPGVGKTTIANHLKTLHGCKAIDEAAGDIEKVG